MTRSSKNALLVWAFCLAALFLVPGQARGREELPVGAKPAKVRCLFIGVWSRAIHAVIMASRSTGIGIDLIPIRSGKLKEVPYEQYDVILILQIDVREGHYLAGRLQAAQKKKPGLRVLRVDERGSQIELIKNKVMEVDRQLSAYWKGFDKQNIEGLLLYVGAKYLGLGLTAPPVKRIPKFGIYHPGAKRIFSNFPAYRAWLKKTHRYHADGFTVAFYFQADYVWLGDAMVIDALIRSFEKQGVNIVPLFGGEERLRELTRACKPDLLCTQRHSGPEYESERTEGERSFLEKMDVVYMNPISMLGSASIDEWKRSPRGLPHNSVFGLVVNRELNGIIEPIVIGGTTENARGYQLHRPIPDRMERFVGRALAWMSLRKKPNREKKVAVLYQHRYLGKGDVGKSRSVSGMYLDVHESLLRFLRRMKKRGFTLAGIPKDAEALVKRMQQAGRNVPAWAKGDFQALIERGDPVLVPLEKYQQWFRAKLSERGRQRVIKVHGPPPGKIMTWKKNGRDYLVLPRILLGNVLIAPQPDRGEFQDKSILHSRDVPPPHQYLAFYWWLQEEFKADAVVHFGTHGSEIYLPGKDVGLSADCFPDIVLGNMPNVNPWIMANVGEAIIAKRRALAVLVDHLVPPLYRAKLNAEHQNLAADITKFRALEGGMVREEYRRTISKRARALGLVGKHPKGDAAGRVLSDTEIGEVNKFLHDIEHETTTHGLHVLGEAPAGGDLVRFVTNVIEKNVDFIRHVARSTGENPPGKEPEDFPGPALRARAEDLVRSVVMGGVSPQAAVGKLGIGPAAKAGARVVSDLGVALRVAKGFRAADAEIENTLRALEARYVPPGPGSTPIRNPAALPTGRNLYGLNPMEIPTREAWEIGKFLVRQIHEQSMREEGRPHKKIAFVLNGMETLRNWGVMESEILYAVGVRPRWNVNNMVTGVELIPAAKLGRPRMDVFVFANTIYVKNFPSRMKLIDEAIRMAHQAEDGKWKNYLKLRSAESKKYLLAKGFSKERSEQLAMGRIFGTRPEQSSTQILYLTPRSHKWEKRSEIADIFAFNTRALYGELIWGEEVEGLYEEALKGANTMVSTWGGNLLGPLSNHHYAENTGGLSLAIEWITGKSPNALVGDLRDPRSPKLCGLDEIMKRRYRVTLLNKAWIQGLMKHRYVGAGQMSELVKNSFLWKTFRQSTVSDAEWDEIVNIYVRDRFKLGLRKWFDKVNPFAFQEIAATLLEANRKGFWAASPETLREIARAYAQSVATHGANAGVITGGNRRLREVVERALSKAPGNEALLQRYRAEVKKAETLAPPGTYTTQPVEGPVLKPQDRSSAVQAPQSGTFPFKWVLLAALALLFLVGLWKRGGAPSR